MAKRSQPAVVRRLKAQRSRHRRRHTLLRAAVVLLGVLITLAGVAMLILPGPALVVIPVGLAVLSLEFSWAERLLQRTLAYAAGARRRAAQSSPRQRLVTGGAFVVAALAFVWAALTYDIPLLPV